MIKDKQSYLIKTWIKGPITLQVYREDGIIKVIPNVKVSDLHLAEWKEVVQACPDRKEKGWKTIYGLIKTRMEYLNKTEKELTIDFNKPLKEQDPLNELNDLANKKRKRTGDLKDHSRSTKKHKSSVQDEEEVQSSKNIKCTLKIGKYLHFSLYSGSETKEGLCKELQFSLVDNSKLNVSLSSNEITPQLSFNHLAIPQARVGLVVEAVPGSGGGGQVAGCKDDYNPSQDGNTSIIFVPAVFVVVVVADVEELACLRVVSYSVQMAGSIEDSSYSASKKKILQLANHSA
ncbi:hypothetical protein Tco_0585341 [Tanacetum coccineum]